MSNTTHTPVFRTPQVKGPTLKDAQFGKILGRLDSLEGDLKSVSEQDSSMRAEVRRLRDVVTNLEKQLHLKQDKVEPSRKIREPKEI